MKTSLPRRVLLLGSLLLLGGCMRGGVPREVLRGPSPTGAITEEEFKALHTSPAQAPAVPQGQEVEVGGMKAYLSLPEHAKAPLPAVLVIHEQWGLDAHIRHWVDRLAANGYAALAVDLYDGKVPTTAVQALALSRKLDPARTTQALKAAHVFLQEDARVRATRTGVLGWSVGGGWSLKAAMEIPELDAAVLYYANPVVTDVEALATIRASVLGIIAARDEVIRREDSWVLRDALDGAGVRHRVVELEGAHGFANPTAPGYDERSAAMAWAETSMFFEHHLRR
ncbi:dienelactone hydrolase family protein [Myxococcus stipitatus DSM 14675]|uniref:Dienelactone hydrolase family protein n=1 Tax=Myxococcus stipitatus (strain DSM 14675 / JCM 12634 / Mx s8) TaxID=1278073 RepID=L7ULU9_MYXSD|nr:dienelactone hydrolase family protein [Myxococcus stipitatus]AGC48983.1 dienelactone hydrolase family protein [Myxococcus stipitatus DSM 14675]